MHICSDLAFSNETAVNTKAYHWPRLSDQNTMTLSMTLQLYIQTCLPTFQFRLVYSDRGGVHHGMVFPAVP